MKLHYYNAETRKYPNFGDDLNPYLWERFLPGFFDDSDDILFVGIGTIFNASLPKANRAIVFGAGAGYGTPPVLGPEWDVRFVRGPLTAWMLGLPAERVLTDPANLVALMHPPGDTKDGPVGFMPHHWTATHHQEALRTACTRRGFAYLDPRSDVTDTLDELRRCRLVLTEAMHGAIVADALRIPWIPLAIGPHVLAFKWADWCASHRLVYSPERVSTLRYSRLSNPLRRLRRLVDATFIARQLVRIMTQVTPFLSDGEVSAGLIRKVETEVEKLRTDFA